MILTFGSKNVQKKTDNIGGESEELRDDRLNVQLSRAMDLKQHQKYQEAYDEFQAVLSNEFLHSSKIDKHVHMKYSIHYNVGDILEHLGRYKEAKVEYTNVKIFKLFYFNQALKIKEKDSLIWYRIGIIEYEHFKDLILAKKCFEAAIQTTSAIERRMNKICQILVKLSEIAFQEFDFKRSEELVDSILIRLTERDQQICLFAFTLKSFFLSLQGEAKQSQEFLNRARQIKPNQTYVDLEIIKKFNDRITYNLMTKDILVRDTSSDSLKYDIIKINNPQQEIVLQPSSQYTSFMMIFDDFLQQIINQCERLTSKDLNQSLIITQEFINFIRRQQNSIESNWSQALINYENQLRKKENSLIKENEAANNQIQTAAQNQQMLGSKAQTSKEDMNKSKRNETRAGLRTKPSQTDQQVKNMKVEAIQNFKSFILNQIQNQYTDQQMSFIYSTPEIIGSKRYLTDQSKQVSTIENVNMSISEEQLQSQSINDKLQFEHADQFLNFLQNTNRKGALYVVKNIIRYLLDNDDFTQLQVNFHNSCQLYKLFQILINNDFQKQSLDQLGSFNLVLTFFEMALYNKQVIKQIKSGALIVQREKLFEYLQQQEPLIEYEFEQHQNENKWQMLKSRFYYAMMFYSFEIKTNMSGSIAYYDRLNIDYLRSEGPIFLSWASTYFSLDERKVYQYGSCKIKEAQVVKDFDEQLKQFKIKEIQEIEEYRKRNELQKLNKIKPDLLKFACFYFEQLSQYLQKTTYQSESAFTPNFSTNEEKILEMWSKYTYCITRCESPVFFKITSHLFSFLFAFQVQSKTVYDQLLKKLEFETLFSEIYERFKTIFNEVMNDLKIKQANLFDLKDIVLSRLSKLFNVEPNKVQQNLHKLEMHLFRIMTPEFTYFQLFSNLAKQGEQIFNLTSAYFHELFFIEMFVAIINSQPNQDITQQLRNVCTLISSFEVLTEKNTSEYLFLKSFYKMISFAFPVFLQCFCNYIKTNQQQMLLNKILDNDNPLLSQMQTMIEFYFNLKFKDLDKESKKKEELKKNEESENEDDEDSNENTHDINDLPQDISLLMKKDGIKKLIVNYRNIQGASHNIDMYFYDNLITLTNLLSDNRFFQLGQYEERDFSNLSNLIEAIQKHLQDSLRFLKDKCSHQKLVDQALKTCFKLNPLNYQRQVQEIGADRCDCFKNEPQQFKDIVSRITFFYINFMVHLHIDSSPFQVQRTSRRAFNSQLEEQKMKTLKNLRQIIHLDMQYNPYDSEMLYMLSLLQNEFYNKTHDSKLQIQYKSLDEYSFKKYFLHSQNSAVMAINTLLNKIKAQNQNQNMIETDTINVQTYRWGQMDSISKFKIYTQQLLQLSLMKIQSNSLMLKLNKMLLDGILVLQMCLQNQPLNKDMLLEKLIKKSNKLNDLELQAQVYVLICEKLDRIQHHNVDPRLQDKVHSPQQTVFQIMNNLIQHIDRTVAIQTISIQASQIKILLNQDQANALLVYIKSISGLQALEGLKYKINFQYPYLQALLAILDQKQNKLSNNKESLVISRIDKFKQNFERLKFIIENLRKSLDVALSNKSFSGVLESYILLIKYAFKISILLKYYESKFTKEELLIVKQQQEFTNKLLLDDKDGALKFILDFQNKDQSIDSQQQKFQLDQQTHIQVRSQIMKAQSIDFNHSENQIYQLYNKGEQLQQLIEWNQKSWLKCQLQYVMTKALYQEILINAEVNKIETHSTDFTKLQELMKLVIININAYDENEVIQYNFKEPKNLVTTLNSNQFFITNLRMKIREFYMVINEKALHYESIKEIFKKYMNQFKTYENSKNKQDVISKPIETILMFNTSKDKYLSSLCAHIERQSQLYLSLREKVIQGSQEENKGTWSQMNFNENLEIFKSFRAKQQVTKDNLPVLLKDVFEIFVDVHMKKSFINQKKLVDDNQKRLLRQAVLNCCAICGPDSEIEKSKVTSKFLDLTKISIDEYAGEGLMICLKWYISVLEERPNKKDIDFLKRLKVTTDEIEKSIREQQQLLISQQQAIHNQETQASKVFQDVNMTIENDI